MSYTSASAWAQLFDSSATAGHYRRATQVGAAATFSTNNTASVQVAWGAVKGPNGGNADVSLDGAFIGTVSLYAPVPTYGAAALFQVPAGRHTIRVTVRGDREPSSAGSEVNVDFFDVIVPVGGRGFGIQRIGGIGGTVVQSFWSPGIAQSGYLIARLSASGNALLPPSGAPLSPGATIYVDLSPTSDPLSCYTLLVLQGNPPALIGNSDVLCTFAGVGAGLMPSNPTLQLNESTVATVSWAASSFAPDASYLVLALGDAGLRPISVPQGVTFITDDTGGVATCYAVLTLVDGVASGNTDLLCGIPGLSRL